MKKFCLFCVAFTTVTISSYGIYVCEKCGHEMHYHESVKTTTYVSPGTQQSAISASAVVGTSLPSTSTTTT